MIEAVARYRTEANNNAHDAFEFSRWTDATVAATRHAMTDSLNAERPDEIVFGQSMTELTFNLSRSIGRTLPKGDDRADRPLNQGNGSVPTARSSRLPR